MNIKKVTAKKVKKKIYRCKECKVEGTISNKLIRYQENRYMPNGTISEIVVICKQCYSNQ